MKPPRLPEILNGLIIHPLVNIVSNFLPLIKQDGLFSGFDCNWLRLIRDGDGNISVYDSDGYFRVTLWTDGFPPGEWVYRRSDWPEPRKPLNWDHDIRWEAVEFDLSMFELKLTINGFPKPMSLFCYSEQPTFPRHHRFP